MYDLEVISESLVDNLPSLLDLFNLDLKEDRKSYFGPCPIHGGDNPKGLTIWRDSGKWRCFTHHCEKDYTNSPIGLVRALISKEKKATFPQTLQWIEKFLNKNLEELRINPKEKEKKRFIADIKLLEQQGFNHILPRFQVRQQLKIPSPYYIKRGYSAEILDKYDVGLCNTPKRPMFKRSVVPIYDPSHNYMIGCTGRSIYEECPKCHCYHQPMDVCPTFQYHKWKNSEGFNSGSYLYNFWAAKEHIRKSGVAILVESPGDIWRLEEAGIHTGLAIMKIYLSNQQRALLDTSGALTLILALNNDENKAGQKGAKEIKEACERIYNVYTTFLPKNDIGCMSINETQDFFLPIIEKYSL